MRRGEWWEPSFGGHLMFITGRNMTLSVNEISQESAEWRDTLIAACKEENEEPPAWVHDKYVCKVMIGGTDINLDKCGKTLEEAKQMCVEFAVSLCKQMLYELGEDIELTHVIAEV